VYRFPTVLLLFCSLGLFGYGVWQLFNPQVVIQWSTASEVDTLGFSIFRGENPDGPFDEQVNQNIIPARGQVVTGSEYQTTDQKVTAGTTYYYQLGEIQMDGTIETFGPIEITAKRSGIVEIALSIVLGIMVFLVHRKKSMSAVEGN
jgi:hypothetical protein